MSNVLRMQAVQGPSSLPTNATSAARGHARRGGDEPSSGKAGFDALLADHAAPPRLPTAHPEADSPTQGPGADKPGITHASAKAAKGGQAAKRNLPGAGGGEGDTVPTTPDGQAAPTADGQAAPAADPVSPVANAAPSDGAPTEPGPGVATVPSIGVPQGAPPTAAGITTPDAGLGDTVGALAVGGVTAPATGIGDTAAALPSAGGSAAPAAVSGDVTASTAADDGAVAPGGTRSGAPMVGTSTAGEPAGSVKAVSWTGPSQGTDGTGPDVPATGPAGVVPVLYTPLLPTTPATASGPQVTGQSAQSWLPEPVPQQVYTAVAPLLRGADGSYGIQLNLHPRDLGAVQVTVDVRHGEIAIQMHAADPAAREALRSGLSDLRQQLEDQGLRAGSMEVGSGGAGARQPETSRSRTQGIELPGHVSNPSDHLAATVVTASTTALDLRM